MHDTKVTTDLCHPREQYNQHQQGFCLYLYRFNSLFEGINKCINGTSEWSYVLKTLNSFEGV